MRRCIRGISKRHSALPSLLPQVRFPQYGIQPCIRFVLPYGKIGNLLTYVIKHRDNFMHRSLTPWITIRTRSLSVLHDTCKTSKQISSKVLTKLTRCRSTLVYHTLHQLAFACSKSYSLLPFSAQVVNVKIASKLKFQGFTRSSNRLWGVVEVVYSQGRTIKSKRT